MSVGNKCVLYFYNFRGVLLTPYYVRIHPFALKLTAENLSHTAVRGLRMQLRYAQLHNK